MNKGDIIVFKKYSQHYQGTFQSKDGNKIKVASLSGAVHTLDASDVQTKDAYLDSIKETPKNDVSAN